MSRHAAFLSSLVLLCVARSATSAPSAPEVVDLRPTASIQLLAEKPGGGLLLSVTNVAYCRVRLSTSTTLSSGRGYVGKRLDAGGQVAELPRSSVVRAVETSPAQSGRSVSSTARSIEVASVTSKIGSSQSIADRQTVAQPSRSTVQQRVNRPTDAIAGVRSGVLQESVSTKVVSEGGSEQTLDASQTTHVRVARGSTEKAVSEAQHLALAGAVVKTWQEDARTEDVICIKTVSCQNTSPLSVVWTIEVSNNRRLPIQLESMVDAVPRMLTITRVPADRHCEYLESENTVRLRAPVTIPPGGSWKTEIETALRGRTMP